MPDPTYVIQEHGRLMGLAFHLDTAFYPPVPHRMRQEIVQAFQSYWDGELSQLSLANEISQITGGAINLHRHGFYHFLLDEDIGHA